MSSLCIVPAHVLGDHRVNGSHLRALLAVGQYQPRAGVVWASNSTLAEAAGLDERHFRRALGDLVEWGYVHRKERAGRTSLLSVVYANSDGGDDSPGDIDELPRAETARAETAQGVGQNSPGGEGENCPPNVKLNDKLNDKNYSKPEQAELFATPTKTAKTRGVPWSEIPTATQQAITQVLDHWADTFKLRATGGGRHTEKRRARVRVRLESFSLPELLEALTGAGRDQWVRTHNHEILWLFENDERVERFIGAARRPAPAVPDRKHREAAATDAPLTTERL